MFVDELSQRDLRLGLVAQRMVNDRNGPETIPLLRLPRGLLKRLPATALSEQGQREAGMRCDPLRGQLQRRTVRRLGFREPIRSVEAEGETMVCRRAQRVLLQCQAVERDGLLEATLD